MVEAKQLLSKEKHVTDNGAAYWILTFYMESTGDIKTTVVHEDDNSLVNVPDLPGYLENLDNATKAKWYTIYRSTAEEEGDDIALLAANLWLQRQTATANPEPVLERVKFDLDATQPELITRSENGQEYISFKLADVFEDKFGVALNADILRNWADKINSGAELKGDIDHEEYDRLIALGLSEEEIKEQLVGKNGLATAVQAVFEKGKLWVRALIDKRYKKAIGKAKGVSMEALITRAEDGQVIDGDLLGWTFAVNDTPGVHGTEIAM